MSLLAKESLVRRLGAMHSLWYDAVATMDLAQVNHVERHEVLPIAFSLFHLAQIEDGSLLLLSGNPPLYDESWGDRMGLAIRDHGKERSVAVVFPRPLPEFLARTFSARVAGADGITVLDGLECWVYQHGLRHLGEVEHARALVGLQGMTS